MMVCITRYVTHVISTYPLIWSTLASSRFESPRNGQRPNDRAPPNTYANTRVVEDFAAYIT